MVGIKKKKNGQGNKWLLANKTEVESFLLLNLLEQGRIQVQVSIIYMKCCSILRLNYVHDYNL